MSRLTIVCVTLFCLLSFSFANNSLNNILFNGDYEFVDLTYPFNNQTIYWPDSTNFHFTKTSHYFKEDGSWYAANDFEAGEHGGTHVDAPYHFNLNGLFVDQIPLNKLIVPLIVADISSKVNGDPNFILYKHHLDYMLNDNMGKPCLVIFKFGWGQFAKDKKTYLGLTNGGRLHFPGISDEVAEWITTSYKNIVAVGVDTASVDPGSTTDSPVHKRLTKAGLYMIENVNFETKIPVCELDISYGLDFKRSLVNTTKYFMSPYYVEYENMFCVSTRFSLVSLCSLVKDVNDCIKCNYIEHGCTALVMPMKIAFGTGAPLRLVAICPKQSPEHF